MTPDPNYDRRPSMRELGLPEFDPLTVEGRIEQASLMGSGLARRRRGRERPISESGFGLPLRLFAGIFALIVLGVVLAAVL